MRRDEVPSARKGQSKGQTRGVGLTACLLALVMPMPARAAPPASTQAEAQAEGSTESSKDFSWPAIVRGGDAFTLRMPMQWGLIAYRPRVRIELGWVHAFTRNHHLWLRASALLDRGRRHVLAPDLFAKSDACLGDCRGGTVAGASVGLGYRWMPVFDKKPWIAPVLHAGLAAGPWFHPTERVESTRNYTVHVGLETGAGLRLFLLENLAIGLDLDLQLDLLAHDDRRRPDLGLGLGVFPVVLEVRR